jgi:glycosyltransferase involved in cell wall biosynthesis
MSSGDTRSGRRVRLCLAVDSKEFGGAEVYVAQLLRHLPPCFVRTLAAVRPIPGPLAAAAQESNAQIVELPAVRNKFDVLQLARATRAIGSARPDLVHFNLTYAASNRHLMGAFALARVPTIATLHLALEVESSVQAALLRLVYRRLRCLIAVSEGTRRQLSSELRVPEESIEIIRHGIAERQPVRLGERRVVRIGGAGRLTRQKGFDILIDAVRQLARLGERAELIVAGDGQERSALEERATGAPVTFAGFVDDMQRCLDGLDVFCLPSRWEAFPFALLEAMMTGVPCVATAVGDVEEALGPAGIIVPAEDPDALTEALKRLVTSVELRRQLGSAAHRRARDRYRLERMIEETVRVYNRVLARRSLPASGRPRSGGH